MRFYSICNVSLSLMTYNSTLRKVTFISACSEYGCRQVAKVTWPPLKFLTAATSLSNRIFQLHSNFFPSSFKHRLSRLAQLESSLCYSLNLFGSLFHSLYCTRTEDLAQNTSGKSFFASTAYFIIFISGIWVFQAAIVSTQIYINAIAQYGYRIRYPHRGKPPRC